MVGGPKIAHWCHTLLHFAPSSREWAARRMCLVRTRDCQGRGRGGDPRGGAPHSCLERWWAAARRGAAAKVEDGNPQLSNARGAGARGQSGNKCRVNDGGRGPAGTGASPLTLQAPGGCNQNRWGGGGRRGTLQPVVPDVARRRWRRRRATAPTALAGGSGGVAGTAGQAGRRTPSAPLPITEIRHERGGRGAPPLPPPTAAGRVARAYARVWDAAAGSVAAARGRPTRSEGTLVVVGGGEWLRRGGHRRPTAARDNRRLALPVGRGGKT